MAIRAVVSDAGGVLELSADIAEITRLLRGL